MLKNRPYWVDKIISKLPDLDGVKLITIATIAVSGIIIGLRNGGHFQHWELRVFDYMVRLREQQPSDPRIIIISISEADLREQNRWPFPDKTIATLLEKLQANQPRVIGLDVYRNLPVEPKEENGGARLLKQLQKPNVITVRSLDVVKDTPSPPGVDPNQVGFNDIAIDTTDNAVRRNIWLAESPNDGQLVASFAMQIAINYLQKEGISPQPSFENPNYMQLGKAVLFPLKPTAGIYKNFDSGGMQIILNYRNSGNVAKEISLTYFLTGKVDPQIVKDKVVLIGSTASSLKDDFFTPFSPALKEDFKMPGVRVHAQMVSQFLDAAKGKRPLFTFWQNSWEWSWIGGWILVGAILPGVLRHPASLLLGVLGSGAMILTTGVYFFNSSLLIPLATPAVGFILAMTIVVTYQAYEARQKNTIVMKLLGQNTSPEIAAALWRGRDRLLKSGKLPGIKLTATMLFLDIKGFSTISESMPPESLLEWLNEILGKITTEVMLRDGIINKFTGDGVMAVFGVPMSRMQNAEVTLDTQRSVYAALAISDRLDILNQSWKKRNLPTIQMRIGIFTGNIVVGSLGGKDRMEYGVIGDSVNTASRLESYKKELQPNNCRILIGYDTLIYLEDRFEVESWGSDTLKGQNKEVEIFLVKASKVPESRP